MGGLGSTVLFGFIVGLLICIPILKFCNKNNKVKTEYDERQEAIRGRSYRYATYTAWIMLGIAIIAYLNNVNVHMDYAMQLITIWFVSALVQVSHALWNDAYWGRNNNLKSYIITLTVVTIINIAASVAYVVDGELIVDGVLTWRGMSAACALLIIIIGIEFFVRNIIQKDELEEEED